MTHEEAVKDLNVIKEFFEQESGAYPISLEYAIKVLKNELSADRPQKWIPCSERLPEEEGEYLVTAKKYAFDSSYYDVQIAYCSPNKKWFRISNCEIVAWMPRPRPWKGTDDVNG